MKKKVLLVACNDLGIGGIQSVMMSIIKALHTEFDIDVLFFSENEDFYEDEIVSYGCKIFKIPNKGTPGTFRGRLDYYIRTFRRYHGAMKILGENGKYDIIHCNCYGEAGPILKAAYICGVPIRISHSHRWSFPLKGKIVRKIYQHCYRKLILKYSTVRIACSHKAGEFLFGNTSDFHVVENAIDLTKFRPSGDCQSIDVPTWSFINVGRWGSQKNQVFLIDVFARIHKQHPDAKLSLVGYGADEDLEKINNKIAEHDLRDSVIFYPGDSDIPRILERNNVFLFPSTFEGLGIVLIEAQAMCMKCFASTAVPGEANLGFVDYLPLDADVWAEAVIAHVEKNGAKRYSVDMSSYDIRNVADKYRVLYSGEEI